MQITEGIKRKLPEKAERSLPDGENAKSRQGNYNTGNYRSQSQRGHGPPFSYPQEIGNGGAGPNPGHRQGHGDRRSQPQQPVTAYFLLLLGGPSLNPLQPVINKVAFTGAAGEESKNKHDRADGHET